METNKVSTLRSSRALANDISIRNATVSLILSKGIDAISFRDVGREAGLTHGALYARFEDVEELFVDLWSGLLCGRMVAIFEAAKYAASNPREQSVDELLDFVRYGEPADVAAVQVLLASRRFVVLREEVEHFVHDYLESYEFVDRAIKSRTLVLFSMVMVKIFTNSAYGIDLERIAFLRPVLVGALRTNPEDVLDVPLTNPELQVVPPARDDLRSQLADQTFSAVGRSGYSRATISRISRRANCSPGAIYKIYASKEDLVVGSLRARMRGPGITALRIAQIMNEGTLTQYLYAAASDQDPIRKLFILEMLMASAQNATLRSAVAAQFARLDGFESFVADIPDSERRNFQFMIRELIALILGTSFLSTVTAAVAECDFNQFAEPFRRSLLSSFPSWPEITRQLKEVSSTLP